MNDVCVLIVYLVIFEKLVILWVVLWILVSNCSWFILRVVFLVLIRMFLKNWFIGVCSFDNVFMVFLKFLVLIVVVVFVCVVLMLVVRLILVCFLK